MKIGIIVHSYSGNTYSVAQKLQDKLSKAGHSVTVEQLKLVGGENPNSPNKVIEIETSPDVSSYEAVIFGAPVRGFSLSPVMAHFLKESASLGGKKVCCFVTQFFPYPWMGGKRSVAAMKELCESKNGTVVGSGIVNWKNKRRDEMITDLCKSFTNGLNCN